MDGEAYRLRHFLKKIVPHISMICLQWCKSHKETRTNIGKQLWSRAQV